MAKKIKVFTLLDEAVRPRVEVVFSSKEEMYSHITEEIIEHLQPGDKIKIELGMKMMDGKEYDKLPDID